MIFDFFDLVMLPNLLLQLGPLPVYTFGVILGAAFLLGVFLFWRAAKRAGFASDPIFDLIFLSVVFALVGGRLVFIASTAGLAEWWDDPFSLFRVGEGVFWAPAFLFGLIVFYLYIRRRSRSAGWSFYKLADLAAPVLALGQGIGFLGAEITSYLSSVGYVALGYFGLFLILEFLRRKVTTGGAVFAVYLFLAGLLTAASEHLRTSKAFAFGADLNFLLGGMLLVAGALGLLGLFARSCGIVASLRGVPSGTPLRERVTVPPIIGRVETQLRFKLKGRRRSIRLFRHWRTRRRRKDVSRS